MEFEDMLVPVLLVLTPFTLLYFIVKSKRRKLTIGVIAFMLLGLFIFCHATPENSVRTRSIFRDNPISSLKAPLIKFHATTNGENQYKLGGFGFSTKKSFLGLWFVNGEFIVD